MIQSLPRYNLKVSLRDGIEFVFDPVRRQHISLTPEEGVRQNLLMFLMEERGYPRALISVEKEFRINGMQKRFDLLIRNRNGTPILMAECKAPSVKLSQEAFDQVSRYNLIFDVPCLIVTNGLQLFACRINLDDKSYLLLEDVPHFNGG